MSVGVGYGLSFSFRWRTRTTIKEKVSTHLLVSEYGTYVNDLQQKPVSDVELILAYVLFLP